MMMHGLHAADHACGTWQVGMRMACTIFAVLLAATATLHAALPQRPRPSPPHGPPRPARSGAKTVEGRIRAAKWLDVVPGDTFTFISTQDPATSVAVVATGVQVQAEGARVSQGQHDMCDMRMAIAMTCVMIICM